MNSDQLKSNDRIIALQAHGIESVDDLLECDWVKIESDMWDYFKTSCTKTWEDDSLIHYAEDLNCCPWCGRRINIKG